MLISAVAGFDALASEPRIANDTIPDCGFGNVTFNIVGSAPNDHSALSSPENEVSENPSGRKIVNRERGGP